ncbi:hypothetical protein L6164_003077 [Bauhinia variegata]|uniref:Uncharacterized protein n=1 Tax=Bauhinia variegata TaxID=167791 RepID=A0ACB9Q5P5_BAUVA|nr:hypothetical protein L6164_003077 [Bauhinia variegata]
MAIEVDCIHHTSLSKLIDFRTSIIHNLPIQREEELPKALRTSNESKNHGGEELLKALIRKRIEKVNMKETKSKPKTESKKLCICAPTNHGGSFKCRYHRISEANKSNRNHKKLISLSFSSNFA